MEIKDVLLIIATISGLLVGVIGRGATLKSVRPKSLLDDSSAAGNFQKLVLELQSEVSELHNKIDGKQLKVHMTIEIDKAPVVDNWQWVNLSEADTKQSQPRRASGGLGMRQ